MIQPPQHFGLTRAATLRLFIAEDVERLLWPATTSFEELQQVARLACDSVGDWWDRFPVCQRMLDGPNFERYRQELASFCLRSIRTPNRFSSDDPPLVRAERGDATVIDIIEDRAANTIAGPDGYPLLSDLEQEFVHLRWRFGLRLAAIAYVLDRDDLFTHRLGKSAHGKLASAFDPDDDGDDDDPDEDGDDGDLDPGEDDDDARGQDEDT